MAATNGSAPPIGIDLGTTHSCVAYLDTDGKPTVIKAKDGNHTTPSHVAFLRSGRAVGSTAKTDPERSDNNTIYDAKRLLGRSFNAPEIQDDLQKWPFTVVADSEGLPKYRVQERGQEVFYAPEQISGFVLEELREAAQQHFGPDKLVADAVITVPAYFTDGQKQATVTAARLAKLDVLKLINEPTAAALAFGLRHPPGHDTRNVLVFDLGGGTFDTVLLERTKDVIRVKNVGGDSHLGGQDFDWELMKVALRTWDSRHPHIQIQPGTKAWRRLRLACELAKKELSKPDVEETWIELVDLAEQQDFDMEIDKDEFEFHVSWLIDRCMEAVVGLLQEAHIAAADVHDVVVVGGASRMTGLHDRLEAMFPAHFQTSLHMTDATINADEAVAIGAAITAANQVPDPNVDRNEKLKIDGPHDVPRPTPPGGTVINATAMTLGIQHGEMKQLFPLIPKGTPLPAEGHQKFTNLRAYQPSILFQVFEGEKPFACENDMLGMFQLPNIRQGPAGSANIMVTLHVGEDGILHATAYDEDTGDAQQLKVTHLSRLDANSINQLQQGSEYYNYSTDDAKSPNGSDLQPTQRLNVEAASGFAKFDSRNTGF